MVKFLKKRWWIILVILFIIGFILYKSITDNIQKEKNEQYKVKRSSLTEVLTLSGKIDAEEKVVLRFQSSGRLNWVGVKVGDYVKKYQTIASLDQRSIHKNLEKALRDYSKERWDFEEDKNTTYKNSPMTDSVRRILEKNQFDLDKAVLDVELQSLALEYSYLYTPIEGVVIRIDAPFAGVNITPAQAEFEIVNPQTLYFSATADQNEVVDLKEKDKGDIIFDSYPDKIYSGEINYIAFSPKTGETGTVYEIRMTTPGIDALRLGMTGDVDFIIKQKNDVLNVPTNYVSEDRKGNYVYVKSDGQKQKKYIEISDEIDGNTIIKSGLTEGEIIYD